MQDNRARFHEHWEGRYRKARIGTPSQRRVGMPTRKVRTRRTASLANQIFISKISPENRVLEHLSRSFNLRSGGQASHTDERHEREGICCKIAKASGNHIEPGLTRIFRALERIFDIGIKT